MSKDGGPGSAPRARARGHAEAARKFVYLKNASRPNGTAMAAASRPRRRPGAVADSIQNAIR
jgi:hypothetical protein